MRKEWELKPFWETPNKSRHFFKMATTCYRVSGVPLKRTMKRRSGFPKTAKKGMRTYRLVHLS